jgi:hypothetical protein
LRPQPHQTSHCSARPDVNDACDIQRGAHRSTGCRLLCADCAKTC